MESISATFYKNPFLKGNLSHGYRVTVHIHAFFFYVCQKAVEWLGYKESATPITRMEHRRKNYLSYGCHTQNHAFSPSDIN